MAAGLTTLRYLRDNKQEIYPKLEKLSGQLADGQRADRSVFGLRDVLANFLRKGDLPIFYKG